MAILRQNNKTNFVQINNETVRDTQLSWEATGMLALLLSHRDNFNISISRLERAKTNGGTSTKRILLELRQKGYVHFVTLTKSNKGEFTGSIWDIFGVAREPDPRLTDEQKEGFNRLKNNNFKTNNDSYIHESKTEGMDTEHADTEGMDKGHTLEEQSKNNNYRITNDKNNNIAISKNRDIATIEKVQNIRPRNETWDTLIEIFGLTGNLTTNTKSLIGKAVKELKEHSPNEIQARARNYKIIYPDVAFTITAFLKHFDFLTDQHAKEKLTFTGQAVTKNYEEDMYMREIVEYNNNQNKGELNG
jgi:hypothetical protein